ncbi:MAG: putative bifunctional diguanylate cyclase/phosphodiesterase [Gammaproteobacteria bacterium]
MRYEVLSRWWHPERGWIAPSDFIPIAEDTGLIVPMTEWVLREAFKQNRQWCREGRPPVSLSVNLSARCFRQANLAATVEQILRQTGIDATRLELELTERSLMQHTESVIAALRDLKSLGATIALDDFGTGYSSLSYLKRFPIDVVKIDRSFIADITTDPDDAAIANAIIAMAHTLEMLVVAEGVETAEQLDLLRSWGCDAAQGYFFRDDFATKEGGNRG